MKPEQKITIMAGEAYDGLLNMSGKQKFSIDLNDLRKDKRRGVLNRARGKSRAE
jgi:hypothetical protein